MYWDIACKQYLLISVPYYVITWSLWERVWNISISNHRNMALQKANSSMTFAQRYLLSNISRQKKIKKQTRRNPAHKNSAKWRRCRHFSSDSIRVASSFGSYAARVCSLIVHRPSSIDCVIYLAAINVLTAIIQRSSGTGPSLWRFICRCGGDGTRSDFSRISYRSLFIAVHWMSTSLVRIWRFVLPPLRWVSIRLL